MRRSQTSILVTCTLWATVVAFCAIAARAQTGRSALPNSANPSAANQDFVMSHLEPESIPGVDGECGEPAEDSEEAPTKSSEGSGDSHTFRLIYNEKESIERVVATLKRTISLGSTNAAIYNDFGYALALLRRYKEAESAFRDAKRLDPSFAEPRNNLGVVLVQMGRYGEAFKTFREAIRLSTDYAEAYANLGVAYADCGLYADALQVLQRATPLKTSQAAVLNKLGYVYARLKLYEKAIPILREAVRQRPIDAEARYNLAIAYTATKRKDLALGEYKVLRMINAQIAAILFESLHRDVIVNVRIR